MSSCAACLLRLDRLEDCLLATDDAMLLLVAEDMETPLGTSLAAKCLYRRAVACSKLKQSEQAHVALLKASRLSPLDPSIASELRRCVGAAWRPRLPAAKRQGMNVSLLLDEESTPCPRIQPAPANGHCAAALLASASATAATATGEQPALTPASTGGLAVPAREGRRFPLWLLGKGVTGAVPRFNKNSEAEAAAFLQHARLGLPAVLTGGALIGEGTPLGRGWDAPSLVRRIDGRQAVALTAPKACNRVCASLAATPAHPPHSTHCHSSSPPLFPERCPLLSSLPLISRRYYRARTDRFYRLPEDEKEEGDYSLRDAFPTGRYALKDPIKVRSKGFLAARDDPNAERVSYLQIPLYNKEGGWGQLDNDMPQELAQEVMHSLNIQALETIKESAGFGSLNSSTLFIAPKDALSPCHYEYAYALSQRRASPTLQRALPPLHPTASH